MHELNKLQFNILFGHFPLKVIVSSLVQLEKHHFPNEVTDDGMVMLGKLEQLEKQLSPKDLTEDGRIILFKL